MIGIDAGVTSSLVVASTPVVANVLVGAKWNMNAPAGHWKTRKQSTRD
jgi:hypothetical protein